MTAVLTTLQIAAAIFACVGMLGVTLSVVAGIAFPAIERRRSRRGDQPPVSIVIPIKTLDPDFEEAQVSALIQDYPQISVTVTCAELRSPAWMAAERVLEAYPNIPSTMTHARETFAASPKVNNLYRAVMDAPHDIIFTKDSNIIIPQGAIAAAVARMTDDVGLVVAVPQAHGAGTFAAEIEASIMNQSHGRWLLLAAALGMGFGIGKVMVFRRSALLRAGGFEAIAHSVGEDSALAHALENIGLKTTFMGAPIDQRLGPRRLADVFHRQLRWTVVRFNNERAAFFAELFGLVTTSSLAAAFAAPLFGFSPLRTAIVWAATWFAFETALALAKGWDVSLTAPFAMIARDSMLLAIWIKAWFTKNVVWASEKYEAHRVAAEESASPAPVVGSTKRNDT